MGAQHFSSSRREKPQKVCLIHFMLIYLDGSREIGVFYKPELFEGLKRKNDDTKCVFKIKIFKLKPNASELSRKNETDAWH